jgi:hypothetical protein
MEPEGSLQRSQELSTCIYPEPHQSNPHHPILSFIRETAVPCCKSHVHILSLRSFIQIIRPGPRLFMAFRNKLVFYGEGLLASRKPQAPRPPLVVCPQLLIQYIRSYPPFLEANLPMTMRGTEKF